MLRTHVLVVDDSSSLRDALRIALEGLGFSVSEAPNGRIALEMARRSLPDLVLVDLNMPVLDGWQFVRVLQQDFRTEGLPALAMTARDDVTLDDALRAGFRTILRKPFTRADLLDAITRFTRGHPAPSDPEGVALPQQISRAA